MSISYSFLYHRDTPIDSQIGWQILDALASLVSTLLSQWVHHLFEAYKLVSI